MVLWHVWMSQSVPPDARDVVVKMKLTKMPMVWVSECAMGVANFWAALRDVGRTDAHMWHTCQPESQTVQTLMSCIHGSHPIVHCWGVRQMIVSESNFTQNTGLASASVMMVVMEAPTVVIAMLIAASKHQPNQWASELINLIN
jgi:hypothetical protein